MSGGLPVAENTFGPTGLVSRTGLTAGSSGLSGYSTMYYMFDAAGNVSERDDASGDIMSTGSYDAFGAGGMQAVPGTTGLSGDPFGFGGQFGYYTDGETRLVLCGQRYYDPGAARWLTRDPIGLLGGVNPYAYCGNNPVGAADPSGLYFWVDDATFALGGAVLGIAGQGLSDVISGNGRASSWQTYTGAAVGGAAGGWSLEYTGPVGAGAIGGAATNFTQQELNMHTGEQSGLDLGSVASNAALGALFGKISTWGIKGINTGRGNFNQIYQQITTKAKNSTISRITALTAGKMFVGRAWATAQLQGAVPNAIWGATGLLNPDTGDSMIGPGIFDQDAGDDCQ